MSLFDTNTLTDYYTSPESSLYGIASYPRGLRDLMHSMIRKPSWNQISGFLVPRALGRADWDLNAGGTLDEAAEEFKYAKG